MRTVRTLITVNAGAFLFLGIWLFLLPPTDLLWGSYPYKHPAISMLRCLGLLLATFGFVLLGVAGLALPGERRRLALRLSAADVLIAGVGLWLAIQGVSAGAGLILLPLLFGASLAWNQRFPSETAASEVALEVPDEVRRLWQRQVGETAAQEERNRLARDLHDSIKQQLFTINVSAAAVQERWDGDPEGARKSLADVRRSVREAMVEMAALLHQLRPQALTAAGLVEVLREQCEALGYRTGAEVRFELGESLPEERLPPGALEALFRIAQESLANVARHARARRIRVWLSRDEETALLRVDDDGQGFNTADPTVSGMGIRNLRERAEMFHAELQVLSAPKEGTTIAVRIPLVPLPSLPAQGTKAIRDYGLAPSYAAFWTLRLTAANPPGWVSVLVDGLIAITSLAAAFGYGRLARSADRSSGEKRFVHCRNAALSFLLAAGFAPWSWRRGQIWAGWTACWLAVALLATVVIPLEVFKLHRASEHRPRWWRVERLRLGVFGWGFLVFASLWIGIVVVTAGASSFLPPPHESVLRPLRPEEIALLALASAVLLYIRTRQPRGEEGAG